MTLSRVIRGLSRESREWNDDRHAPRVALDPRTHDQRGRYAVLADADLDRCPLCTAEAGPGGAFVHDRSCPRRR